jgi:hypothetical protein
MKSILSKACRVTATIMSGMTLSSLLITESNNWKWTLPVTLVAITLWMAAQENNEPK